MRARSEHRHLNCQNTGLVARIVAVMIIIFDFNFSAAAAGWPFHSSDTYFALFQMRLSSNVDLSEVVERARLLHPLSKVSSDHA